MRIIFSAFYVALLATVPLVKPHSTDDLEFRDLGDLGLVSRSPVDAALSSLTTRELFDELYARLARKPPSKHTTPQARQQANQRCKTLLANAAGKTIHPNAVWPLEECLAKLFEEEGVMPVANWKVGPPSPPGPAAGVSKKRKTAAGRRK